MTAFFYIAFFLILCCFLLSCTDLLPKRNWLRRVATVSKLHQWWGAFIGLVILGLIDNQHNTLTWIGMGMSLFTLIHNGWSLRRYTPYYPKRIADGVRSDFKIMALNVRQKNKDYNRALRTIKNECADIVVLTETNGLWAKAIAVLDEDYPFHVKVPLENTYGMMLYSKHEILRYEVKFLVNEEVPSIHARLMIASQEIQLILIHPEPPLDFKRLKEKDLEILKVTMEADESPVPSILCGDLNDVGWSYASRHMCSQTELEDPRIGRGFFNTYNALIPGFRYPIDHFFMSSNLKVESISVLDKCGSDHFPVSISIELPNKKGVDL